MVRKNAFGPRYYYTVFPKLIEAPKDQIAYPFQSSPLLATLVAGARGKIGITIQEG